MNSPIRLALVDDEALFTEGLSLLLSSDPGIAIPIIANGGLPFLAKLSEVSPSEFPHIVILDLSMKPMNGFEVVERLKAKYSDLKVIILSSHYKNAVLSQMIKLGVSAFLPKSSTRQLLLEAIDTVHRTGVFFTQKDHQMLLDFMRNGSPSTRFQSYDLSDREKEVIQLICQEMTNNEIAEKLFLSKRTVESHRQRILTKIGAKNTVGLVLYAIAHEIHIPKFSM